MSMVDYSSPERRALVNRTRVGGRSDPEGVPDLLQLALLEIGDTIQNTPPIDGGNGDRDHANACAMRVQAYLYRIAKALGVKDPPP